MSKSIKSSLAILVILVFITNYFACPYANASDLLLPAPGVMVPLSPEFNPPILKGIKVHPDNPFQFDFILDLGDERSSPSGGESNLTDQSVKDESSRLIKYFLAGLTTPDKDLWVNLSPYEKDRIIPQNFGLTEMGRDLLAEDYMLKQITASLIYPEYEIGKKFWKRIYQEAQSKFGTTNIPVNTFNKVWIVPEKAIVYENAKSGTAYVVESSLKVMLEQDYLSLQKHSAGIKNDKQLTTLKQLGLLGANIIREIVIPELTKEVNENKNFAQLRQVYNSLILATWYKKKIKDSILSQVYEDKNKVAGINIDDPQEKEKIYQQYLKAFKKGVYNYIKDDIDPLTQASIPRKYFSGGFNLAMTVNLRTTTQINPALLVSQGALDVISSKVNMALKTVIKPLDRATIGKTMTTRAELFKAVNFINFQHSEGIPKFYHINNPGGRLPDSRFTTLYLPRNKSHRARIEPFQESDYAAKVNAIASKPIVGSQLALTALRDPISGDPVVKFNTFGLASHRIQIRYHQGQYWAQLVGSEIAQEGVTEDYIRLVAGDEIYTRMMDFLQGSKAEVQPEHFLANAAMTIVDQAMIGAYLRTQMKYAYHHVMADVYRLREIRAHHRSFLSAADYNIHIKLALLANRRLYDFELRQAWESLRKYINPEDPQYDHRLFNEICDMPEADAKHGPLPQWLILELKKPQNAFIFMSSVRIVRQNYLSYVMNPFVFYILKNYIRNEGVNKILIPFEEAGGALEPGKTNISSENNQTPQIFDTKGAIKYFEHFINQPDKAKKESPGLMRMNVKNGKVVLVISTNPYDGTSIVSHDSLLKGTIYESNAPSGERDWVTMKWGWDDQGRINHLLLAPPTVPNPYEGYTPAIRLFLGKTREDLPKDFRDIAYQNEVRQELIMIARLIQEASIRKGINPESIQVTTSQKTIAELSGSDTNLDFLAKLPLDNAMNATSVAAMLSRKEKIEDAIKRSEFGNRPMEPIDFKSLGLGKMETDESDGDFTYSYFSSLGEITDQLSFIEPDHIIYNGPETKELSVHTRLHVLYFEKRPREAFAVLFNGLKKNLSKEPIIPPIETSELPVQQLLQPALEPVIRPVENPLYIGPKPAKNGKRLENPKGRIIADPVTDAWFLKIMNPSKLENMPWELGTMILSYLNIDGQGIQLISIEGMFNGKPVVILSKDSSKAFQLNPKMAVTFKFSNNGEITLQVKETRNQNPDIRELQVSAWNWNDNVEIENRIKSGLRLDSAMAANGGIDLTPSNMNLQTQNSNGEIKFHLDPAMLIQLQNAPGFTPVIISVKPLKDLATFLEVY